MYVKCEYEIKKWGRNRFFLGTYIKQRFVDYPKVQIGFGWTELGGDVFIPIGKYWILYNIIHYDTTVIN